MNTGDAIARVAALLRQADHAVALTGAGLSTPSGIPDFRSPGLGLWERMDPLEVASIYAFRRNPRVFYDWMRPLVRILLTAEPNDGHRALADLEAGGWLKAVITQNIDNLHQRAGSHEVLELHGHLREAACISCYQVEPTEELLERFLAFGEVPRCPGCGGVMKPSVVLYGEQLPIEVVNASVEHVREADLMLVAGSSLETIPASELPLQVYDRGGRIVVLNLTATHVDDVAEVVIRADVAEALPRIAQTCANG